MYKSSSFMSEERVYRVRHFSSFPHLYLISLFLLIFASFTMEDAEQKQGSLVGLALGGPGGFFLHRLPPPTPGPSALDSANNKHSNRQETNLAIFSQRLGAGLVTVYILATLH